MPSKKDIVEHARYGNTNAQETIRFIDTKIGVALAFLGAICGGAYSIWATSLKSLISTLISTGLKMNWLSVLIVLSALCLIGFLVCLVRTIHFCCLGLSPRPPNTEGNKVKHSVLFPYVPSSNCVSEYRTGISKLTAEMPHEEILSEFEDQSVVLGQIIAAKMAATKTAITNLKWLVYFLITMSCVLTVFKCLPKKTSSAKGKTQLQCKTDQPKTNLNQTPIIRSP
jgi:hypothetical protein